MKLLWFSYSESCQNITAFLIAIKIIRFSNINFFLKHNITLDMWRCTSLNVILMFKCNIMHLQKYLSLRVAYISKRRIRVGLYLRRKDWNNYFFNSISHGRLRLDDNSGTFICGDGTFFRDEKLRYANDRAEIRESFSRRTPRGWTSASLRSHFLPLASRRERTENCNSLRRRPAPPAR